MRLQIKKLDGPDEIQLNTNTATTYAANVVANTVDNKFTCYFNRAITAAYVFPMVVRVKIYNAQGTEQNSFGLTVNRNNVNNANTATANFCFTVTLNSPQALSGSYFHVHAVITNAVANAQNVSYGVSSYHQTIKKVFIYADKVFNQVYWSSNEQITNLTTQESLRTGGIGQNEDAFLHIKTTGMYKDTVAVILTADNDTYILSSITTTLNQNMRVVAFDMGDVIRRYRRDRSLMTGDVNFTLKAWVITRDTAFIRQVGALGLFNTYNPQIANHASRILPSIRGSVFNNLIMRNTGALNVSCIDTNPAVKRSSTGTVYVNVNTGATLDIVPTKFRDFRIGYVGHLEGIGNTANYTAEGNNNPRLTVYPVSFYEIKVSDLVASGIITIEDAIILAPLARTAEQLNRSFNKLTARISNNVLLIDKFRIRNRNNRVDGSMVRKLLAQVRTRNAERSWNMCRDGWQRTSKKKYSKSSSFPKWQVQHK